MKTDVFHQLVPLEKYFHPHTKIHLTELKVHRFTYMGCSSDAKVDKEVSNRRKYVRSESTDCTNESGAKDTKIMTQKSEIIEP